MSVPSARDKHKKSILYSQNTIQNDATITNNDCIQSCETPKHILTYQPFQHLIIIHNVLLPHTKVDLLIPHLQYYLHLVKNICVLWRKVNMTSPPGVLNQVYWLRWLILFFRIDTFEQQCVMIKVMFQSPRLKYHVQTIGIYPSLSNNAIYNHKCLEIIKKLYKQSGKCDDQQQFKDILEADMVSTPEGFTDNSPISPMTSSPVKKTSAQKSLCMFTNILDMNKKLLTVKFLLLNISARRLNVEIHYGNWNKSENGTQKSVKK